MAKEKGIEIKTGPAIKNIGDLKNNITLLKKALEETQIGTQKYRKTLSQLQENQSALRNAMHGTAASMKDITDAATAANVQFDEQGKLVNADAASYNELVRTLAILKQEWRSTYDEETRADLSKRINSVNDQLKNMDASVGVFGRNVGNYIGAVDHLANGMASMGRGASAVINPLKNVTTGFKTLSATPAVAILGLLANVIMKIIDGLESSEKNTQALTAAMAPLKAIGDMFTKTLQQMGAALVKVVEWFGKLTGAILGNNEATEKRIELAEREKALTESMRDTLVANAEAERDISELRAKAADKATYSAKERIGFLEEAGEKEREIAERAMEDAKAQYEIIKLRNSMSESNAEALDREAEAYAKMVQAETAYYDKMRSITKQLSSARKEAASEAAAARKAMQDAAQKEAEAFAAMLESIDEQVQSEIESIGAEILEDMDAQEKAAADKTKRMVEAVASGVQQRQAWNEVLTEDEREQADRRYQIQMEGWTKQLDILEQERAESLDQGYLDSVLEYETQIAAIKEGMALETAKRQKAIREQDLKDTEEKEKQKRALLMGSAGAVADIFNALADIYEADAEHNKKAAEKAKALRIATTVIDTLSGAVAAFKSGVESGIPAPYNMVLAAAQAAAVTVAGMANVAKIKSTQISTGGGASSTTPTIPAAVSAPTVEPEVNRVRTITGASEEDRLNQMAQPQRVYILSSDLEADRKATQTQIEETTF